MFLDGSNLLINVLRQQYKNGVVTEQQLNYFNITDDEKIRILSDGQPIAEYIKFYNNINNNFDLNKEENLEQQSNAVIKQHNILGQNGANTIQNAAYKEEEVHNLIGMYSKYYPEWKADNEIEKINHITYYPKTNMAYICISEIQRFEHYAPDVATNNYCPYPSPDINGVYPYINGMLVWKDMIIKDEDILYKCILQEGTYKLVNPPKEAPSIFEEVI